MFVHTRQINKQLILFIFKKNNDSLFQDTTCYKCTEPANPKPDIMTGCFSAEGVALVGFKKTIP
jgi:hypothetical protein